jgi:putative ferrous iron transport protein C
MILSDLRNYLQIKRRVALGDLVTHFQIDADALRGMLAKWVNKGKVRQISPMGEACGSQCCKCDPALTEIYEWLDDVGI